MLTHDKLVELHQELATIPVLSVYLDGNQHDPAQRNAWRTELEHGLDEARRGLNSAGDEESKAFDLAARFVQGELQNFDGFLPDKAFVAFATADRLWYGETVSVSMPNLVRWERGTSVAPYVRGLKQERPVVVALLDSQRARVFLYRDGGVEEVADLRADTFVGDLSDSGMSKRSSLSSGLRGETRTDAAQRVLRLAIGKIGKGSRRGGGAGRWRTRLCALGGHSRDGDRGPGGTSQELRWSGGDRAVAASRNARRRSARGSRECGVRVDQAVAGRSRAAGL